jgi:hypothetical protein
MIGHQGYRQKGGELQRKLGGSGAFENGSGCRTRRGLQLLAEFSRIEDWGLASESGANHRERSVLL